MVSKYQFVSLLAIAGYLKSRVALPSSSHDSGMLLSVSVAISERPKVLPINQNSDDVFYQRNDFQKAVK